MAKTKKRIFSDKKVSGNKIPHNIENPDSYLSKRPSWRFEKTDSDCDWDLLAADNLPKTLQKLKIFEGMTWSEIQKQTHDTGKSSNHFISLDLLDKKAQNRFEELKYDDYSDNIFSLRLNNKERLFGILIDGVFHIVWYDKEHQICPSKMKHT